MSEIQTFTIKNATITINSATKLQFNSIKCDQIKLPYILCTAFECKNYVLLFELEGYSTDKIIEPTIEEIETGTINYDTPYFIGEVYDELYDDFEIKKIDDTYSLAGLYKDDALVIYNNGLHRFHVYKVDEKSWNEIDLELDSLYKQGLVNWNCFASGWMNNEK